MRFNKQLKSIGADFRRIFLNSTDEQDNAVLPEDWRKEKVKSNLLLSLGKLN